MRIAAKCSLVLNVLLAVCVLWLAFASSRPKPNAPTVSSLTNRVLRAKQKSAPVAPTMVDSSTAEQVAEAFQWAQLESSDYRVYVANLRGIGCPEQTVRDIVVADVNDVFAPRVKEITDPVSAQFWAMMTRPKELEKIVDEKRAQLEALETERDEILKTLFGNRDPFNDERQRENVEQVREHYGDLSDFLPTDKQARYIAAREELEAAWHDILRAGNLPDAERKAKRKELVDAHEKTWREWLSDEELEEIHLRESWASGVRDGVRGMDVTDDEVRAAAKIQFASQSAGTPETKEQTQAQLRDLFGDRYAAFARATDGDYSGFYSVAERLDLPESAAIEGYNIRKDVEAAVKKIFANPALSEDDRKATLQAIADETRKSLGAALGPRGMTAYQKVDGSWIDEIPQRLR